MIFAAIVTTMLCVPVMALLAGLFFVVGGSLEALLTFGGALHPALGLVCWWAIGFPPALAYVAFMMPWHSRE